MRTSIFMGLCYIALATNNVITKEYFTEIILISIEFTVFNIIELLIKNKNK